MAEYMVTVSALNGASGETKNQAEAFREAANGMLQATQALTSAGAGWDDDASQIFREKIEELKRWCDTMGGIVDTYGAHTNPGSGAVMNLACGSAHGYYLMEEELYRYSREKYAGL